MSVADLTMCSVRSMGKNKKTNKQTSQKFLGKAFGVKSIVGKTAKSLTKQEKVRRAVLRWLRCQHLRSQGQGLMCQM